jgi:hypothetical protein
VEARFNCYFRATFGSLNAEHLSDELAERQELHLARRGAPPRQTHGAARRRLGKTQQLHALVAQLHVGRNARQQRMNIDRKALDDKGLDNLIENDALAEPSAWRGSYLLCSAVFTTPYSMAHYPLMALRTTPRRWRHLRIS